MRPLQSPGKTTGIGAAGTTARRPGSAIPSAIDVVAPIAVYLLLHLVFGLSDLASLMSGAAVAAAATGYTALRRGHMNSVGLLVMIELGISIVLVLVTQNPRILLFKPAVMIGLAGLYLLFTCMVGRPLAYQTVLRVISQGDAARAAACERAWNSSPEFRMRLRVMTAGWGIPLLFDAVIRVYFALTKPIAEAAVAPHIASVLLIGIALAIAAIQFRRMKRIPEISSVSIVRSHHLHVR